MDIWISMDNHRLPFFSFFSTFQNFSGVFLSIALSICAPYHSAHISPHARMHIMTHTRIHSCTITLMHICAIRHASTHAQQLSLGRHSNLINIFLFVYSTQCKPAVHIAHARSYTCYWPLTDEGSSLREVIPVEGNLSARDCHRLTTTSEFYQCSASRFWERGWI